MKKLFNGALLVIGLAVCYKLEAMMQSVSLEKLARLQNELKQAYDNQVTVQKKVTKAMQNVRKLQEKLKETKSKVVRLRSQVIQLQQETQNYNAEGNEYQPESTQQLPSH